MPNTIITLAPRTKRAVERWRPVPGFRHYSVSTLGNVMSHQRVMQRSNGTTLTIPAKVLKPGRNADGYPTVTLNDNGVNVTRYVHDLVTSAFLGNKPAGRQVRHLNDDKGNCTLSNLRYGTRSQNQLDSVRNGRHGEARRTHCDHGHEYTAENTIRYRRAPRTRICKRCREIRQDRRRRNHQETVNA